MTKEVFIYVLNTILSRVDRTRFHYLSIDMKMDDLITIERRINERSDVACGRHDHGYSIRYCICGIEFDREV